MLLLHGPQEIWSGGRRRYGTFLHSPLLDELKSLESMLVRQAAKCSSKAGNGAREPQPSIYPGGSASTTDTTLAKDTGLVVKDRGKAD